MNEWEPAYGFGATRGTSNVELAEALEFVRRRICGYGSKGNMPCDCKYGAKVDNNWYSEQNGCPELREMIYRLLHGDKNVSN